MTGKLKYSLLNKPGNEDIIQPAYRAMRFDPFVWKEWIDCTDDELSQIANLIPGGNITPGSFALTRINVNLVSSGYPINRVDVETLEECMDEYQLFLQHDASPINLLQAGKIAIVVIEKRRISENWVDIFTEISKGFTSLDRSIFVDKWRSIFGIVGNLVDSPEDFFPSITHTQNSELINDLFISTLMMLAASDQEKINLTLRSLEDLHIQKQVAVLGGLVELEEERLTGAVSKYLLENYEGIDIENHLKQIQQDNQIQVIEAIPYFQSMASLARISGNRVLESEILQAISDILNGMLSSVEVQKAASLTSEISDGDLDSVIEIANSQPENLIGEYLEKKARSNPNWKVSKVAKSLLDRNEISPIRKVISHILQKNPVNEEAISVGVKFFADTEKNDEFTQLLEGMVYCGNPSEEDIRTLIERKSKSGKFAEAFEASEVLFSKPGLTIKDRIQHSRLAAKSGHRGISRQIVDQILRDAPDNVDALCASGEFFYLEGKQKQAVDEFWKATELDGSDESPWIRISEIQTIEGNKEGAIDTLKKGLIALPGNPRIRSKLASILLEQGSTAEAINLLRVLRLENNELESNLLLIKALNQVNHEELDNLVIEVYEEHPDNPDVSFEYAELMLRYGNFKESAKIMKGVMSQDPDNRIWALTFADALVGLDPRFSKNAKQFDNLDYDEILSALQKDNDLEKENDPRRSILRAEILLQKGLVDEANRIFAYVNENYPDLPKNLWMRMRTWLSWTSAALGKLEIALTSIRDVIDADPDLLAPQQVLAEILALADETQEACDQALLVLEMAPDLVENLLWAGEFFTNLGKTEKAIEILSNGSNLKPEEIKFDMSLLQLYKQGGFEEEVEKTAHILKAKLTSDTDTSVLFAISSILDGDEDDAVIENLLLEAYNRENSPQSALNLAGYQIRKGKFESARGVLAKTSENYPESNLLACCLADILISMSFDEDACKILSDQPDSARMNLLDNTDFLPDRWKILEHSNHPVKELLSQLMYAKGDVKQSLALSKELLSSENDNLLAWVLGIESARALGDTQEIDEFLKYHFVNNGNSYFPYYIVEGLEENLELQKTDLCWDVYNSLDEKLKSSPVLKIVESNLLFLEGNTLEAEEIFSTLIHYLSDNGDQLICSIIRKRLLINLAALLSRWSEALTSSKSLAKQFLWNVSIVDQYLAILVQASEFDELAKRINLVQHTASSELESLDLFKELELIDQHLPKSTLRDKWMIRGKLAAKPNQQTIKEYALNKPTPDDAAILIRALNKMHQGSTAQQVAKKFPESYEVLLQRAINSFENNPQEASEAIQRAMSINSNQPTLLALSGYILRNLGKTDLAIHDLESALAIWPDELNWHKTASELWFELGNDGKATQHMEFVNSKTPGDIQNGVKLSKTYLAGNNFSDAIELLLSLTTKEPNDYEIWESLTDAYLAAGLTNEALDAAEKASQANPFSVKPFLIRAKINLENGLIEQAFDQVNQADLKVKDDAEVKVALAKVLLAQGEKAAALSELEKATQCKNLTPQMILDEVKLIKEINGTASARNLIEYFANKMPENTELLSLLAFSQLENGDTHGAEVTAHRVLKLKPDSIDMLTFLGKRHLEKGQLDQAIHSFSQVIQLDLANSEAYYALSSVYEKQRETSKAIDMLRQLIEIKPKETIAYISLAGLYKEMKNYKMAEEMLKKAVELEPKNINVKRQLGALLALNLVHQSQEVSSQL